MHRGWMRPGGQGVGGGSRPSAWSWARTRRGYPGERRFGERDERGWKRAVGKREIPDHDKCPDAHHSRDARPSKRLQCILVPIMLKCNLLITAATSLRGLISPICTTVGWGWGEGGREGGRETKWEWKTGPSSRWFGIKSGIGDSGWMRGRFGGETAEHLRKRKREREERARG